MSYLTDAEGVGVGEDGPVPTPPPPLPYSIPEVEVERPAPRPTGTGSMRAMRSHDEPHTLPGWVAGIIYLTCLVILGWAIVDRML